MFEKATTLLRQGLDLSRAVSRKARQGRLLTSQTANSALNIAEERARRAHLRSYPREVEIELTKRCNLLCEICNRDHASLEFCDMPLELARTVARELLPRVQNIAFCGWGEPTYHTRFEEVLSILFEQVTTNRVAFVTNATLLTRRRADLLVGHLDSLIVSVHGGTPETYETVMKGARWSKLEASLDHLLEARRRGQRGAPELHACFAVYRENVAELPAFVGWCARKGLDGIVVQHFLANDEQGWSRSLYHAPELAREQFSLARATARSFPELRLVLPELPVAAAENATEAQSAFHRDSVWPHCSRPWRSLLVDSDGRVYPCCHFEKSKPLGQLSEELFPAIWNGDRARELRRRVDTAQAPYSCRNCPARSSMATPAAYRSPLAFLYQGASRG